MFFAKYWLCLGHFQAFLGASYVDNFGRTVHCMRGRQPVTAEPVRERSPAKPSLQVSILGGLGWRDAYIEWGGSTSTLEYPQV